MSLRRAAAGPRGQRGALRATALSVALVAGMFAVPAAAKPVVTYGTFLGSSGHSDSITASAVDADGNLYVAGGTDGADFPATEGSYQAEHGGGSDAFLAKFDPAGELVFSTFFGGTHHEAASGLAIGADGTVYLGGATLSADLPVTPGALQTEWRGDVTNCEFVCAGDGFIARFSSEGDELLYSTFLGGEFTELVQSLLVDDQGRVYAAGFTTSPDFPTTSGVYDESYNVPTCFDQCDADAFVARLDPAGTQLDFSTFYGGTSWDSPAGLDVDAAGNIYIGGGTRSTDLATTPGALQPEKMGNGDFDFSGYAAAFSPDASELLYGTYLGKRAEDQVTDLDVEDDGTAWVTGFGGRGFPITEDALQPRRGGTGDAFVTALAPDGSAAVYGTYLGGDREDYGRGIMLDDKGFVLLAGSTASQDLPTRRATQSRSGGMDDLFFARFRPGAARPRTLTYLGGEKFETSTGFATGPGGVVYLTGTSESPGMPLGGRYVQDHVFSSDAVVVRLQLSGLVASEIRERRISARRLVLPLTRATVRWRNTTDGPRRLVETGAHLFTTTKRPPGSDYYFSFPAGRFVIADPVSDSVQRVAVAPRVAVEGSAVDVRWARMPLGEEFVFDVQVAVDGAPYEFWQEATNELAATFNGPGEMRSFRVRVSNLLTGETSAWSPPGLVSGGG